MSCSTGVREHSRGTPNTGADTWVRSREETVQANGAQARGRGSHQAETDPVPSARPTVPARGLGSALLHQANSGALTSDFSCARAQQTKRLLATATLRSPSPRPPHNHPSRSPESKASQLTNFSYYQKRERGTASHQTWSACAPQSSARPGVGPGW